MCSISAKYLMEMCIDFQAGIHIHSTKNSVWIRLKPH